MPIAAPDPLTAQGQQDLCEGAPVLARALTRVRRAVRCVPLGKNRGSHSGDPWLATAKPLSAIDKVTLGRAISRPLADLTRAPNLVHRLPEISTVFGGLLGRAAGQARSKRQIS